MKRWIAAVLLPLLVLTACACGGVGNKETEYYEVGEEVTDEVFFEKFGRRAILNLRQTLASKILELQKDAIYNQYKDKIGQLVSAEVYQIWKKEMLLIDDEGNEMILPKSEQIPGDFYRKGETARAAILQVDNKLSFLAHRKISYAVFSNSKFPRYTTASSRYTKSPAFPANAQKLP